MTLDNLQIDYVQALREICRVLKSDGFYLANEHFDIVSEIRKTNSAVNINTQLLLDVIENDELLAEIGFKPVVRIEYLAGPQVKPFEFTFYLFQKD